LDPHIRVGPAGNSPPEGRAHAGAHTEYKQTLSTLYIDYTEKGKVYGILFTVGLFCEQSHLDYVRTHAIYRVNQAVNVIHILVVAPQEDVNIESIQRVNSIRVHPCLRLVRV